MAAGKRPVYSSVDAYIASFPADVQTKLERVRRTIRRAAPGAEERISYQIPAYRLNGRYLVYFAGFKQHIGVYPLPKGDAKLITAMTPYQAGKGTVRFVLDKPLPLALIRRIVLAHKKESIARQRGR